MSSGEISYHKECQYQNNGGDAEQLVLQYVYSGGHGVQR